MSDQRERSPRLPPRWFIRLFWRGHRALYRLTGGRTGLWSPGPDSYGVLRLTAVGRRTGRRRGVMLAYLVDGSDLVTLAMNGWGAPDPAWWLNLQAHPEATVELSDGPGRVRRRRVRARAATGDERERLWDRWRGVDRGLDGYAARRPGATAVVVLEPVAAPPGSDGASPDGSAPGDASG